ncbi:hypothetical protein LRP52_41005 [Photobacterium sp. ZSDE20]|uniref:KTSC domain-containing protein n=1 Tax=Photobacterium pectinilyticum TaxID=2906793 RepID=A0ABT1N8E7_9GAMM|nr:hypothetical protein [Photobacterium sp. ZSDE20]MCQ1060812.1 hypothetical protein [Photobacterium sp. ZSDE20]MDD1828564.1 hypothetical protein [Photobacterium sp. ZSDE20]
MKKIYQFRGVRYYTEVGYNCVLIFNADTHQFVYQLYGSALDEEGTFHHFVNKYMR